LYKPNLFPVFEYIVTQAYKTIAEDDGGKEVIMQSNNQDNETPIIFPVINKKDEKSKEKPSIQVTKKVIIS
jgi:hypothetical protein